MKKKQSNTLKGKTGKDLLNLLNTKDKKTVSSDSSNFIAPVSETEKVLFEYWKNLLGHGDFGTGDDFFMSGGNSIKAIQLLSRISSHFSVELETSEIFLKPTISQLAGLIDKKKENKSEEKSDISVSVRKRPEEIPLSFSQERLLFIDKLEGSLQYHLPAVFKLNGKLNKEALVNTLNEIIRRHEILRTVYFEIDGKSYQKINENTVWKLNESNGTIFKDDPAGLKRYIRQLINKPFDLSNDHMVRADLINTGTDENILIITLHHIASDGWSVSIFAEEFLELYSSFIENRKSILPELNIQYADHAIWQRENIRDEILNNKLEFWKNELQGVEPLELPTDLPRPNSQSIRGASVKFEIKKELRDKLVVLGNENNATLFMTLLSAFNVLLYRYTGQEDICAGTPVAGRHKQEFEKLIGFFINTLALRNEVKGNIPFTEFLKEVRSNSLKAFGHQEVPFEKVVEATVKERILNRSPLFQVMFILHNTPEAEALKLNDLEIEREDLIPDTSMYEITFNITETESELKCEIIYCTELFNEKTILRMADHYSELLNSIARSPEEKIDSLSILTEDENIQLDAFAGTNAEFPKEKSIIEIIEERTENTPDKAALIYEDQSLTYPELNEKSNQIANYLISRGIKNETLVPICIERGFDMIAGILGILKAGAAYVPIDPQYPEDRKKFIIEDTGAEFILSSKKCRSKLPAEYSDRATELDTDQEIKSHSKENVKVNIDQKNLAYIIYTSGSTGKPKGVMIEHGTVVNLIFAQTKYFGISEDERILQFANFSFDASVEQIFLALFNAVPLVLIPDGLQLNKELFEKFLVDQKITHLHATPSFLENVKPENHIYFKRVIAGGDVCKPELADYWKNTTVFYNEYGPTETTVTAIEFNASENKFYGNSLPIGKPLSNVKVYILDKAGNRVPVGVNGELYLGGDCLARGYLNSPELTKESFIKNPFSKDIDSTLYKTGDICRWLDDGNIEYKGRIDDQVKIRGFRIELGEIESVIQESGAVKQSVVVASETSSGGKRLIGYIVPEGKFDKERIIAYLGRKLPEYMIPAIFVDMVSLPLNKNGKVDRKALPDPDLSELLTNEHEEPRNEIEISIAGIWKELLNLDKVGINDNFFELGGDSIITIQVVSRARRAGIEMKPADIFIYQTIRKLSSAIETRSKDIYTGEQGLLSGIAGLLPVQQAYFERAGENKSHFNQSILLSIDKSITQEMLGKAVEQLTSYHDALRFEYRKNENEWIQRYGTANGILLTADLRNSRADKKELEDLIKEHAENYQKSLDIEKGELARFVLVLTPEEELNNRIFIIIHHLAVDGVSWRILLGDLEMILENYRNGIEPELGEKGSSYRQWYQALAEFGKSKRLQSQENYWKQIQDSYKQIKVDKEYSAELIAKDIELKTVELDQTKTRHLLKDVPGIYHTDINDILLCALAMTLCSRENSGQIVIGMEGHGREEISDRIDISRTVGWFTSIYPVLLNADSEKNISDHIKSVKEQIRRIPGKGLGYGVLKYINKNGNFEDSITPEILYNYLGQLDNVTGESNIFSGTPAAAGTDISPEQKVREKLTINAIIKDDKLVLNWNYSTKHFEFDTINKLTSDYSENLNTIITHCLGVKNSDLIFTPSDFGLGSEISYEELDGFLDEKYGDTTRRNNIESIYRLSGLQEGMLFHALYDTDGGAYIEQLSCDLKDPDIELIRKSWNQLIVNHSSLRSGFYNDVFRIPVQVVYRDVEMPVILKDLSGMGSEEQRLTIEGISEKNRLNGFSLSSVPLMNIVLLKLDESNYKMIWTSHHLLFDGWSLAILMEEFLKTYEDLTGSDENIKTDSDNYLDYIRFLERKDKDEQLIYWKDYMQGIEQSTLLPFSGITTQRTKGVGDYDTFNLILNEETKDRAESYAQKNRLTLNTLLQGVWSYLLHRYTGNEDVAFGVIVSGRPDELPGIEKKVGLYINTLPLHSRLLQKDKAETINWLQEIQSKQVESAKYQYTPLQEIQNQTGISGDLFDSIIVFENYPLNELIRSKNWKLKVDNVMMKEQSNYPLSLLINNSDQININFIYNENVFNREYINEISKHFENVLQQIISNEKKSINDIYILSESDEKKLLSEFNDTEAEYPVDKSAVELFEEQVLKTPESIAVVYENESITYKELDDRASKLANHLIGKGINPGDKIGLLSYRCIEMMTGIFGILKAGCSYVPFNTDYPAERIQFITEDCGIKNIVYTDKNLLEKSGLKEFSFYDFINIEDSESASDKTPGIKAKIDSCIYVMFTSGTTGRPKGIAVSHRNVIKLVYDTGGIAIREGDRVLQWSNYSFDGSTYDIYGSLLTGASLHLIKDEWASDGDELARVMTEQKISVVFMTTALFNTIVDINAEAFRSLRKILFGGEMVSLSHVNRALDVVGDNVIMHVYGPTETTTYATSYTVNEKRNEGTVPIGKPLSNTQLYVLDTSGKLVPVGVGGELHIGGDGVSMGYISNEELTKEKFIPNPFSNDPDSKIYKTGDLCRWTAEGNIEYLGRIDDQVKIRGYRIELSEIESVLFEIESVSNAVILAKEDKAGTKKLVAYVVPEDGFNFNKEEIISQLRHKLPDYMIPALWVEMESLPLNTSGKINKKALPDIDASELLRNEYIAPRNETEEKLAAIWKDLLNIEQAGINDNFFELGGHSLLAIRLISAIRREFNSEISIKDIFYYPTITELADLILKGNSFSVLPPIKADDRPEHIPLSFSQERLWFIDRLEGTVQYHIPAVFRLKGDINKTALSKALQSIIERHEVLRTVIYEKNGTGYQKILNSNKWGLHEMDGAEFKNDAAGLQSYIQDLINKPFDLLSDFMLRADLINVDENESVLVVTMHHISSDGWSLSVIVNELAELYKAYCENREANLLPLQIQYADFSIWQKKYLTDEVLDKKLEYWKSKLTGAEPLQLPADFIRPAVQSIRGASFEFKISKELTDKLEQLSKQNGATLYMTLLAAFNILLYRYSGQKDISVGSPVAGRQQKEAEHLIGFFVNTLVLRNEIENSFTFTDLLEQVKINTFGAFENQEVPFEKIVEAVVKQRDVSRSPLFQIMFILQNAPEVPEIDLNKLVLEKEEFVNNISKFDISVSMTETPEGLIGSADYCTDLFKENTIAIMMTHFKELLNSVAEDPENKIGSLPMLTKQEEHQILSDFNGKEVDYPKDKTIFELFEDQVKKTPDSIAVVFEDEKLTFKELDEKSNQLAHYLHSKGVKIETLVPICLERSLEMIIGLFGIMKSGGAYVPVDPEYPQERINFLLEDTSASIVVSKKESSSRFIFPVNTELVNIDSDWSEIEKFSKEKVDTVINSTNLAYVIYTSGSTGRPKGVMNEHRGVVNRLLWGRDYFNLTSEDSILQKTTYCFDVSVWELFSFLISGARLVFARPGGEKDTSYLKSVIDKEKITMIHFVPSMLEIYLNDIERGDNTGLKYVVCSGEALKPSHAELFKEKFEKTELHNLYGPTEAAIEVTYWELPRDGKKIEIVPIGKAISNTSMYILNNEDELVPVGGIGQLHIGGVQVARGYLNRPELTKEKFVKDPFSKIPGSRIYRTGDLSRWLPDGNIEYAGRMDDQVKIRGFRIELGEIESVLMQSGLVQQTVMLAPEDASGSRRLVAYVTTSGDFKKEEAISYLQSKLPQYMVPAVWVEMESFPLNQSGKINKKLLPKPADTEYASNEYIAPRNITEEKLAEIWKELLHADRIGIKDNFFDLGGHSLLAMRVISSVRKELGYELSIKDFFIQPTVEELARLLEKNSDSKVYKLPIAKIKERPEFIPLSFSQERIWFIDKLEGSIQYHMPAVLRIKGNVDTEALESTFKNIVNRHEILRTVIKEHEGKAYQYVNEKDGFELEFIDGTKYNGHQTALKNYIQELINVPFDLAADNMLRGHLIKLNDDEQILVLTMHHIASDGWSISVIVKELVEFYKAHEEKRDPDLNPLEIQFADYSIWQREYLQGEVLDNKLDYWKEKLYGVEPLQLPVDFARPAVQSKKGANANFSIDKNLTDSLLKFSRQNDVTLFMTLLSAYNVLLYRYSGQEDFTVGSPVAGRQQAETEDMIGFFINTVAMRSEINGELPFRDFLHKVRSTTLEAYEHQDVPFEKIVDAVVKQRDMSRSPLFQVSFMLQNTPEVPELKLGDAILNVEEFSNNISKIDITFSLTETPEGIEGNVEYCTDLYTEETILRMTSHFKEILVSVLKSPDQKIGTLNMITEKESRQLLIEFNDNERNYPKEKTIADIIEEYGKQIPESTALEYENEKVSYIELNERSNQFAHYLKEKGVKTETFVPICIDRSIEMIIAIFGILKAGAAYVPIDPEYPEERMLFMLEDINANLLITSRKTFDNGLRLPELNSVEIIEIDSEKSEISKHSKENLQKDITPENLAYVIYTSGSTGKPKGVMIEHKGVVNLSLSQEELLWLKPGMKTLQFASSGFDASCYDIFNTLLSRGCLVLCNKEDILSADKFQYLINEYGIELATLPSSFQQTIRDMTAEMPSIKTIVSAGEALNIETAETFTSRGIRVVNAYGPTETTVCATLTDDPVREHNVVTIGKPNPNQQIYIVDKYMNICPVGVPGEICVAGIQVARGYLNRPELSSEKFVLNPFDKGNSPKLYRTGDLGKWLPDGNIEYMGRLDDQIKLRGYRIEPGEIENVLQKSEYVRQAVVMVKADEIGNKRLVGYIVPEGEYNKGEILNYLKKKLPDYMIPALWVEMESLPVTPSGKIDRKALPEPEAGSVSAEYEAPRNETEKALSAIWKELLHADQVGIHDNFFDLGGDSIITIQVQSRARRLGYELKPNDIFIHQTISSLSAALSERTGTAITGEQGILSGKCGLLPIQQWYFEGVTSDLSHFNQSVLLSIDKSVTPEVLDKAVNKLTVQHDALRFIYHYNEDTENKWDQEYGFNTGKLIEIDLQSCKEEDLGKEINDQSDKIQRSLDIEKGEIAKFALFKTPESDIRNRILIVIHHLAVDGVSWRIILDDLELLITGLMKNEEAELGVKSSSYRQWYNALKEFSSSERLLSQSIYWENAVSDIEQIPTDKEYSGEVREKDMETFTLHLDKDQTELLLHEVPRVYHTDINDILLCALAQTLTEWSASKKIVIGLEGHGRENISDGVDTSRTVGWFTSLFPVSLEISPNWDSSDSIKRVKEQLRQIPDKGLGFGILKYLNKNDKLNTKTSWNIVFNYLGQIDNIVDSGKWISGANESRGEGSGADHTLSYIIAVNSMVQGGELILNWSYSKLHFEKDTISGLAENFNSNMNSLIDHCMDQQKSGSVYTPSDYGLESDISIDELDELLNKRI